MRVWICLSVVGLSCGAPPAPKQRAQPPAAEEPIQAAAPQINLPEQHEHGHEHAAAPAAGVGLVRIAEPGNICMLSNRYLGDKQHVPATVEGKTYFGCCANCAARIEQRAEARTATDPVSGKPVDKASAVLARDAQNRVLYFESEDTFAQMQARTQPSQ